MKQGIIKTNERVLAPFISNHRLVIETARAYFYQLLDVMTMLCLYTYVNKFDAMKLTNSVKVDDSHQERDQYIMFEIIRLAMCLE